MISNGAVPVVPEEVVTAYERKTGFVGIGDFFEKEGIIAIKRSNHASK